MVCCDGYLKWKNRRKYILLIFRLHYCTRLGSSMFNSKWSKVWMLEVDRLSVTSCWYKLYSVVCSKESSGIYERIYKTWRNKGTFFTWRRYISVIWITCWYLSQPAITCSKLTINSVVFILYFEHISHLTLVLCSYC